MTQESIFAEMEAPTQERSDLQAVTYSALSMFRNCRRMFEYRYIKHLIPIKADDDNLRFGSLIHSCLEKWHGGASLTAVLEDIDRQCEKRSFDADVKQMWHLARAMMRGYAKAYPTENFNVIALEKTFSGPIINPETGAASRSFVLCGKVDGILNLPDGNYILETKTASGIDAGYLDKLWTDFQITIYSHYVERYLNIPITGIIYNVLVKAKLKQSAGETEDEFHERYLALAAKNKSGKSTAQRQMPETDYQFATRLDEKYAEPGMFHREVIYLDQSRFPILQAELWELTKSMLDARRRGVWYQNTSQCFAWNRPCAYLPICKSGDNPVLIENLYQIEAPNTELRSDPAPIF